MLQQLQKNRHSEQSAASNKNARAREKARAREREGKRKGEREREREREREKERKKGRESGREGERLSRGTGTAGQAQLAAASRQTLNLWNTVRYAQLLDIKCHIIKHICHIIIHICHIIYETPSVMRNSWQSKALKDEGHIRDILGTY